MIQIRDLSPAIAEEIARSMNYLVCGGQEHLADLRFANLGGADLRFADLRFADLGDADLGGADGSRTLAEWQADPLAGLCDTPEAVEKATAAWGDHAWGTCPMSAGLGIKSVAEAPEEKRLRVAMFVALFDGGHLPKPALTPSGEVSK